MYTAHALSDYFICETSFQTQENYIRWSFLIAVFTHYILGQWWGKDVTLFD